MSVEVQNTSTDALASKLSACSVGYIRDPFLPLLAPTATHPGAQAALRRRRSPLIHRGYFARHCAVDGVVWGFLDRAWSSGGGLGAGVGAAPAAAAPAPAAPAPAAPAAAPAASSASSSAAASGVDGAAVMPMPTKRQVVSLGAGWETIFLRLRNERVLRGAWTAAAPPTPLAPAPAPSPASAPLAMPSMYVELDLPGVVQQKVACIWNDERLRAAMPPELERDADNRGLRAPGYRLASCDLTDLASVERVLFEDAGLDPAVPTLFISECVLVYVDPEDSGRLIQWAAAKFERAAFFTYEQILPYDAFGDMMVRNLRSRGIDLKGIVAHPDLDAQKKRFLSRGWTKVESYDMMTVYYELLPKEERARIERLEIFDEFEEFHLFCTHYSFTLAVKAPSLQEADGVGVRLRRS